MRTPGTHAASRQKRAGAGRSSTEPHGSAPAERHAGMAWHGPARQGRAAASLMMYHSALTGAREQYAARSSAVRARRCAPGSGQAGGFFADELNRLVSPSPSRERAKPPLGRASVESVQLSSGCGAGGAFRLPATAPCPPMSAQSRRPAELRLHRFRCAPGTVLVWHFSFPHRSAPSRERAKSPLGRASAASVQVRYGRSRGLAFRIPPPPRAFP